MTSVTGAKILLTSAVAGALVLSSTASVSARPSDVGDRPGPSAHEGSLSQARDGALSQHGVVESGEDAVSGAKVLMYQAGRRNPTPRLLGEATTADDGSFTLSHRRPSRGTTTYLVARAGNDVVMATVLGTEDIPSSVVVNERTTVATGFAMAQFIDGTAIGGPSPGLPNAAGVFRNLVDLSDGGIGEVLAASPNGPDTLSLPTMNSLANLLTTCTQGDACDELFEFAAPTDEPSPTNTLEAITAIAHEPGSDVEALLGLAQTSSVYEPALPAGASDPGSDSSVNSLALLLLFDGAEGPEGAWLNGPGNIAFDSEGNAWVNNNYAYASDRARIVCGSTVVAKFTPTGELAPGAPYGGNDQTQDGAEAGGLYGAGYGIAVDPDDHAWVINFGFQGQPLAGTTARGCQNDASALAVSVSEFDPDGTALSPDGDPSADEPGGYIVDGLGQPQGILSDRQGNIWFAGCIDGTVTRMRRGDPDRTRHITVSDSPLVDEFDKAFDVAIDRKGHAWVTANGTSNVVEVDRLLRVRREVSEGIDKPMGIASDSKGNLWVADAGLPNPPCPPGASQDPSDQEVEGNGPIGEDGAGNARAAVTLIDPRGTTQRVEKYGKDDPSTPRDGLRWPWGIAVDGDDTVWVANFAGQRIMHLCGADERECRGDAATGDPLSPDEGYYNDALARLTALQVDPSGNLWMTNNWALDGFIFRSNPGGRQVGMFVGLAAPVQTPLLGTVRSP